MLPDGLVFIPIPHDVSFPACHTSLCEDSAVVFCAPRQHICPVQGLGIFPQVEIPDAQEEKKCAAKSVSPVLLVKLNSQ